MAITRAQQVRQMLEDGGMLVSPSKDGKRPGYRNPNEDRAREEKAAANRERNAAANYQRSQTFDVSKPKQSTFSSEVEDQTTPEDRREIQRILSGQNEKYEGTTQMGDVDEKPIEIPKKSQRDTNKFVVPSIFNREFMFNLAQKLPRFGAPTIKERQNAYKEYLKSMGVSYPETLDSDNPFDFFESDAFRFTAPNIKDPITDEVINVQNYGDFALENFGTPGIKFSGDVGNKEVFVKGYRDDGSKIYGVREKRDDGPGDQILFPVDDGEGGGALPDDPDDNNQTGSGLSIRFRKDGGRINAMDGGMMSPEGGIMDLETGRQMYFLGKLVKKATRAVKKVAKSPIGKAALLYFGGQALAGKMGGLGGLKGTLFGQAGSRVGQSFVPFKEGLFTKLGLTKGGGSLMPTLKGGIALASLAPLLFQQEEEEDDELYRGPGLDIRKIRENPYDFLGPNFANNPSLKGTKD